MLLATNLVQAQVYSNMERMFFEKVNDGRKKAHRSGIELSELFHDRVYNHNLNTAHCKKDSVGGTRYPYIEVNGSIQKIHAATCSHNELPSDIDSIKCVQFYDRYKESNSFGEIVCSIPLVIGIDKTDDESIVDLVIKSFDSSPSHHKEMRGLYPYSKKLTNCSVSIYKVVVHEFLFVYVSVVFFEPFTMKDVKKKNRLL